MTIFTQVKSSEAVFTKPRAERAKADNDQDRASLKRLDELMPELDKLDAALKVKEGLDR